MWNDQDQEAFEGLRAIEAAGKGRSAYVDNLLASLDDQGERVPPTPMDATGRQSKTPAADTITTSSLASEDAAAREAERNQRRDAVLARLCTGRGKARSYEGEHRRRYRQLVPAGAALAAYYDLRTLDVTDKRAVKLARWAARRDGNSGALLAIKNEIDKVRARVKAAEKAAAKIAAGEPVRADLSKMTDEEKAEHRRKNAAERKRRQRAKAPTQTQPGFGIM